MATHWGDAGVVWGAATGTWGGSIFNDSLTESRTATDSYTPNLVIPKTLSESSTPTDTLTVAASYNVSLTESLTDYWGTAGILWGGSTGTWGGDVLDSLSSVQIFACPLTETITATESLTGLAIFPNILVESVTPVDTYVPNLVIPVAATESGTAADTLTAGNVMVAVLSEPLANYWGSAGILWGATTGTWGGDVQDSLSAQQVFACSLAETVTALDTAIAAQVFVSSLIESVTATDALVPNLVLSYSLSEAGGAIDLLVAQQVFKNILLEFGTASEALTYSIIGSTASVVVTDPTLTVFGVERIEDPLGVDIFCFPDFDPIGVLVSGITALAQRVARRLTNNRGTWFWAPNECTDTRQYLNDILTQERISVIQNEIERETLREESVKTVSSKVTFDASANTLDVELTGVTSEGPFNFVFEVTSSKLTILS